MCKIHFHPFFVAKGKSLSSLREQAGEDILEHFFK